MAQYITRTASAATLTTSYTTLTSNFADSGLSIVVPSNMRRIAEVAVSLSCPVGTGDFAIGARLDGNAVKDGSQDLSMGALIGTTSGQTGTANGYVKQSCDIPVQPGNTLNMKLASTVSAANCDICMQVTFA